MPELRLTLPAQTRAARRAHVGVVGSGDCEILLRPGPDEVQVRLRTTVAGFDALWIHTLEAFFAQRPVAGDYEVNDFGATPAVVTLRLLQLVEAAR